MTDTQTGGINVSPEMLKDMLTEINKMDEQLDAAGGQESAGRRALGNELAKSVQAHIDAFIQSINSGLTNLSEEQQVGFLYGARSAFTKEFEERTNTYLDEQVKNRPQVEKLPEDELSQLAEQRKEAVKKFKAIKELIGMFGHDVSQYDDPKRRTGSRGARAISSYTWSVDGVRMEDSKDSLAGIANQEGYASKKELSDAMREAKIDLKNPEGEIRFKLKNDKTLVGNKSVKADPTLAENDDDDDDEVDSVEVTA